MAAAFQRMRRWWAGRARGAIDRRLEHRPFAEAVEPRILYSADLAPVLLSGSDADSPEQRSLTGSGEYATSSATQSQQAVDTAAVAARYATVPLSFEANTGQAAPGSDFIAQGSGYGISLEGGSAVLTLGVDADARTLRLTLDGANADPAAQGRTLLAATTNYLVGSDPAGWHTGIANYADVVYGGVYDGIDLRYYGNQGQLEYDFIVAAGADAGEIRLRFDGALSVAIAANGDLVLTLNEQGDQVSFKAPVSWQEGPGGREAVASSYVLHPDGSIGFALGVYDATRTLVIDPVLNYASYFGTSGTESGLAVAVDASGAVYITGRTTNSLPTNLGGGGGGDVYVAKFSADLSTLIYSTRVGGTGDEQGNAIAVDGTGAASVTGWTKSTNFPSASGSRSGAQDAFVFRLNPAGSALTFSTYLGGVGASDSGNGIAVDAAGNLYVAGQKSQDLVPLTIGIGGLGLLAGDEAFITKFNSAGAVQYSGLLGGTGTDYATGVAVDPSGNAYLVGNTNSGNLPMVNAHDTTRQGDEGFLFKINAAGDAILYSSYIGGSSQDSVTAVAVDAGGKAYVTGYTEADDSSEFQVTSGAFQAGNGNNQEAGFVRIYDTSLSDAASLVYSTFLGGDDNSGSVGGDFATGIAVNAAGQVYVVGRTNSEDFPTTPDGYDRLHDDDDGASMFLVVLNPLGAGASDLAYGTLYGEALSTGGVAASGGRALFVGTTATSGLATAGSAQPTRAGGNDAIVVGFDIINAAPVLAGANNLADVLEDAITNNGTLVSALIAGQVSDTDFGTLTGIAVTAVDNSNGTWQYSLNGGSGWSSFGSPSDAVARLLAADALTRIRFVPNANFAGTGAGGITFRAWDRATGTAGANANTSTNGGTTAYSSATASSGITVTAVNDAPARTAGSVANLAVVEDSGPTSLGLGTLAYGAGGGADEAGQALTYSITAVPAPALGSIVLADGATVVASGTSWTLAQLQGMQFTAAADAHGGPATFSFSVSDNGGTANGGADSLAQSLTITVTPVNDAPVLTGANNFTGLVEDPPGNNGALVCDLIAGRVSDVDAGALTGIAVTGVDNSNGAWQYSRDGGSNWTSFGAPSDANARLLDADSQNRVRFVPNADFAGTAGLSFRAWDDSGSGDGGTADATVNGGSSSFSAASFTAGITVSPVNDAPVRTGGSVGDLNVAEDAAATSLGLSTLAYSTGGGADEALAQTLNYTVTAVPSAALGQVVLADGVTVVSPGSYTLAELQGMQFKAAANASGGPATFSWTVQDNGGTAGGGSDTLAQLLTISVTPRNDAPTLAGANAMDTIIEGESGSLGTLVSALIAGQVGDADAGAQQGIAVVAVDSSNGAWQYSLNGGGNWNSFGSPSATSARLLAANGSTLVRFVPNADFAGTVNGGITFRAWDRTSGTAGFTANVSVNGDATAFSAQTAGASITVTGVNDAPVRTAGSVDNLTVAEDAGATALGLGGVAYAPGGGADETGQALAYTVTTVPAASLGQVVLADGTTAVTAGATYTLAQLQGMQFKAAPDAIGTGSFSWSVSDDGGTAGGGADTLAESLNITVTAVNDAPVRSAGAVAGLAVLEDSGATSLGLAGLAYTSGGGADESGQVLTYRVTAVPTAGLGQVVLADGTTEVTANTGYTLAQLQGMQFRAAANANGSGTFSWTVQDSGGTAGGGVNTLAESLGISVDALNDAPVLTAGTVANLTVAEDAAATSLGLGGLAYGTGGGADEAGQALSYTVSMVPAAGLGQVVLADGTTVVTAGAGYSLAQLQGMKFKAAADAIGTAGFSWTVQDSGGTALGGGDSLAQGLAITVNAVNDAPVRTAGAISNLTVQEDSGTTSLGLSGLAYGTGGGADEAGQVLSYTVTAVPAAGLGQVVLADGTTVVTAGAGHTLAQLRGMQFKAAAHANGTASFSWSVQDNGGTALGGSDMLAQSLDITISPVNDAPVRTAGATSSLTVQEDSATTSLGLGALSYGAGGGTAESGQALAYTVTTVPAASLGQVVLADGTTAVTAGTGYTLAQLRGMQFRAAANANGGPSNFSWNVVDDGGVANGGANTLAESLTVTVNAVNDAPLRTAGTIANLTVLESSGTTGLGLAGLAYGVGGGADEAGQQLSYTVTAVPSAALGDVVLADGTTVVTGSTSYTLEQLQGMQFRAAASPTAGAADFTWQVQDDGGTALGGYDTLAQTLRITVGAVNDAPVRAAGAVSDLAAVEDSGTTSLGLGGLAYGPGGGPDEAGQVLSYTVTAVPAASVGQIVLLDGTTVVTAGAGYTLAQLQGMQFKAAANANGGPATFSWTVQDDGGTALGGVNTLAESLGISVAGINDAPVRTAGTTSNLMVQEDSGTTGLGLGALNYSTGGGADEAVQVLSYTVTAVPAASLGQIVLADGTTAVTAGAGYSLAQLQGMQFKAAANANGGAATFSWTVQDGGGTALGGVDLLGESLMITGDAVNDAPVLTGGTTGNLTVLEDSGTTSLGLGGLAYGTGGGSDEAVQTLSYTVTAVPAPSLGEIVLLDGTTVVTAGTGYTLAQLQGMQFKAAANANGGPAAFSWTAQDSGGTALGGVDTLSQGISISITSVNDAPLRTAGATSNLTVQEDSGTTGLGLGALNYSTGGGADEAVQVLSYTVTAVPAASLGQIVLADGTTVVSASSSYTLAQLQGMQFKAAANANGGPATFSWTVRDNGAVANGGVDLLAESLTITVDAVNDAPVLASGAVGNLAVAEDSGTTSLGLSGLGYGPGGGGDEAGQAFTYTVTAVPAAGLGQIVLANGTTLVTAGTGYTLAQLQGMQFKAAAHANGAASFSWSARDSGGTALGGVDTLSQNVSISVTGINDAPVRTAGTAANLTVQEDSGATSLGLGALSYGTGGGADEAVQVLSYTVTAVPAASLGQIVLADGTTVVTASAGYTLAQLQGMQFRAAANANGGPAIFSWTVQDSGGVANGGVDLLGESLTITVNTVNDAPVRTTGAAGNFAVQEDSGTTGLGLGALGYATGGGADEASQALSYTVTAVPAASLGQIMLADGTTVVTAGTSYTLARLQGMQFKAAANANGGPATFSWTVQDDGGTATGGVDALGESLAITVNAINDAPVRTAGATANLTVQEDSGTASLALGALSYSVGGGADEGAQTLGYTVTAVPAASLGRIVLADGTTVVTAGAGYTLAQLQGMQFKAAANANGTANFSWSVQDSGGTALGGADTLAESLSISITGINDAPVRTAGVAGNLAVLEDSGATSLGLTGLTYGTGGGSDEAVQTLSYSVTAVPAAGLGQIVLADGTTVVTAGAGYTLAQLQGMQFRATANANGGPATFSWTVQDSGGVSNGGLALLGESLTITVGAVNDAPVLTAGLVSDLTVLEASGTTGLGLGLLQYGVGGAADESGQALVYTVTAVPPPVLGDIVLSDGVTVVTAGTGYSIAQLHGMQFRTAGTATIGEADFTWTVQDDGGTANGGVDLLGQALRITVDAVNDAPVRTAGNADDLGVLEDTGLTSLGLGGLAYGPGGGADEAGQTLSYTVTAVPVAGLGQIVLADGTTVVTASSSYTLAQLQGMQFKAAANANGGPAVFSWTVRDDGGTALGGMDTLAESLSISVAGINDAPMRTAGATDNLAVLEDSGATSLGLGALSYGTGGGADEAVQALSYTVTAVPAASLGRIVLLDGTTAVTAGTGYTLAQLQGMQFKAMANANGTASFSWRVVDDGGTALGGVDTASGSLTLAVAPVNDAPTSSDAAADAESGAPLVFTPADFAFDDSTDPVPNAQMGVRILRLPDGGALTLGGAAVQAGQDIAIGDIAAGQLVYAPHEGPSSFDFVVYDDGGTANGGANADATPRVMRIAGLSPAPPPAPAPPAPPPVAEPVRPVAIADPVPEAAPAATPRAAATEPPAQGVPEAPLVAAGVPALIEFAAPEEALRASFEAQVSPVVVLSFERRAAALFEAPPVVDFSVASLGTRSVAGTAVADPLMRSLRATEFTDELDRLREEVRKNFDLDRSFAISAGGVTLGFSVLYVLWLIRGGVLMSSYLAAMPAWRVLDPLPVLSRVDDEESDDEDGLHGGAAVRADDPVQTLRGY